MPVEGQFHPQQNGLQTSAMHRYYRWHAQIYDATRWIFLHGRKEIVRRLDLSLLTAETLLEVGCGTGYNLRRLGALYPEIRLFGVDVSPDMLARAARTTASYSRRLRLIKAPYAPRQFILPEPADIVLFSYALTMFNPGWEAAIARAWDDLEPGGRVAVVDFYDTPFRPFRWWMHKNHVRMDGHLLPALQARFRTEFLGVRTGGLGLWQYFLFVGKKV